MFNSAQRVASTNDVTRRSWIRRGLDQGACPPAWANIPPKRNRKDPICFSPYLYRARNLIERFFNKIKQCRRVATRYDKLAANYLAFVKLASIRVWLRANESTPQLGGVLMSDKRRARRTDLFAYGKTVWSRHPLLVPSRAEAKSTQPSLISLNPLGRPRTYWLSGGRTNSSRQDHLRRDARRRRAWPSGAATKSLER